MAVKKSITRSAVRRKGTWHLARLGFEGVHVGEIRIVSKEWYVSFQHEEYGEIGQLNYNNNGEKVFMTDRTEMSKNIRRRMDIEQMQTQLPV